MDISEVINLMREWQTRAASAQRSHGKAAARFQRRHYLIGVPTICLTAIVGTTIFATISDNSNTYLKVISGVFSILAAVMSGLQTFLNYQARAERHLQAAKLYGSVSNELEQEIVFLIGRNQDEETLRNTYAFLAKIRERWDKLREDTPLFPGDIWYTNFGAYNTVKGPLEF